MSRRWPDPDFLQPVARPGRLAWVWCATGLLVLATSALEAGAAWQGRQVALASLERRSPQMPKPVLPTPTVSERAQAREVLTWQAQLALPWPAVWAASELAAVSAASVSGGVVWLQMDMGVGGGLRLLGQAADLAAAQAAAEALRRPQRAGGPQWQPVVLASVDRMPEGLRFELQAQAVGLAPTDASRTDTVRP